MKFEYIDTIVKQIKNKTEKELIKQELECHIQDKIDYYTELGYSPEIAEQKAIESMGNAEDIATSLSSLHDVKWYKKFESYIAIFYILVLLVINVLFPNKFDYTNPSNDIVHYITVDFISIVLLFATIFIIRLGRIRHSLVLTYTVSLSQFIVGLNKSIFAPAVFAFAKIFINGFGGALDFDGYVRSIFTYSYPKFSYGATANIIDTVSVATPYILLLYGIFVYIKIHKEQRTEYNIKFTKYFKIFEYVMSCILVINFVVMCTGTAIAVSKLDDIKYENTKIRKKYADFVLQADIGNSSFYETLSKLKTLSDNKVVTANYPAADPSIEEYYKVNEDNVVVDMISWGQNNYMLAFERTDVFSKNLPMSNNMLYEEADFDKYTTLCKNEYNDIDTVYKSYCLQNSDDVYTLDDFLYFDDIYYNAASIFVSKNDKSTVNFVFCLKDTEKSSNVNMVFNYNILTEIDFY